MSTLDWVPLMAGFVISERAWSGLPESLRPKLAAAVERATGKMRTRIRADSEAAVRIMEEHGLTVRAVAPDSLAIWQGEVRRCFDQLIGGYINAALVRQIEETLRAYRATN